MYYVMRPDNVNDPHPVFTRYGRLSHNLHRSLATAAKLKGRVYETNGAGNTLVKDFWEYIPPAGLAPSSRVRRMQRAEMALFGRTL